MTRDASGSSLVLFVSVRTLHFLGKTEGLCCVATRTKIEQGQLLYGAYFSAASFSSMQLPLVLAGSGGSQRACKSDQWGV